MKNNIPATPNLPKVCFVIATLGHGRGGHFWSLKTTVEALRGKADCFIIDIGVKPSPVVEATQVRAYHIHQAGINPARALRAMSRILTEEQPDVLNLFDGRADLFARLLSIWHAIPMMRTKCGGPSPRHFPHAGTIVVYSREDQQWFSRNPKFARSDIHLIPNRVLPVTCDPSRVEELRSRISPDKPVFLRISRFSIPYEKSMFQGIQLVKRLNLEGHPCQLVIVGAIEHAEVHARVLPLCDENIHVFTEDTFTLDAKALIDIADFIIGTGRGFMEAASCGKVMLSPLQSSQYPLLLTEDTFEQVFATNFSPRNQVLNHDEEENYQRIAHLLDSPDAKQRLGLLALAWFDQHFHIASVIDKYAAIFLNLTYRRRLRPRDLALSWYGFWRSFRSVQQETPGGGAVQ